MTEEEKLAILEEIEQRLKLEPDVFSRPILCSALNPDIITDEEYEKIKDYDFAQVLTPPRKPSRTPNAHALLFVRNFYERGRGNDPWQTSVGYDNGEIRQRFKSVIDCYLKWEYPKLMGNDIRDNWLPYHCWLLKAEDRGQGGERLKYNARFIKQLEDAEDDYNLMKCSWESLLERTPDEIIDYNKPAKAYFDDTDQKYERIIKLWEYAGEDYLYSMKALVSSDDEQPEEFYYAKWLQKIWGMGRKKGDLEDEIENVKKDKRYAHVKNPRADWCLERGASYRLRLIITPTAECKEIIAEQIENHYPVPQKASLKTDVCAERLTKHGIRCDEPFYIRFKYADGDEKFAEVPPLSGMMLFYNIMKHGSYMRQVRDGCRSSHSSICVMSAGEDVPEVTFANHRCTFHQKYVDEQRCCSDRYKNQEYQCRVYNLCDENQKERQGELVVTGNNVSKKAQIAFYPELFVSPLDESDDSPCLEDEGKSRVFMVGNSARVEFSCCGLTRIEPRGIPENEESSFKMEQLGDGAWKITVGDALLETPISIKCAADINGKATKEKELFFISPERWGRRRPLHEILREREFAAIGKEVYQYTTKGGEQLTLSCPLRDAKLYWNEAGRVIRYNGKRDINDLQEPQISLEVWSPAGDDLEELVKCGDRQEVYEECGGRSYFIENRLQPGCLEEVEYSVGGTVVASGKWKPRRVLFVGGRVYAHPSARANRAVCCISESTIKECIDENATAKLEDVFIRLPLDDLQYDEDYFAIIGNQFPQDDCLLLMLIVKQVDDYEVCESIFERYNNDCYEEFFKTIDALGDTEKSQNRRLRLKKLIRGLFRRLSYNDLSKILEALSLKIDDNISSAEYCKELNEDFKKFQKGWVSLISGGALLTRSGELLPQGHAFPIGGAMYMLMNHGRTEEPITSICIGTARIRGKQGTHVFYNHDTPTMDKDRMVCIKDNGKLDISRESGMVILYREDRRLPDDLVSCIGNWTERCPILPNRNTTLLCAIEDRAPQELKAIFKMLEGLEKQLLESSNSTAAAYLLCAVVMSLISQSKKQEWSKIDNYPDNIKRQLSATISDMDSDVLEKFYTFVRWAFLCFASRL